MTTVKQMRKMCRVCFGDNITSRATVSCTNNEFECDRHYEDCRVRTNPGVHGEIGSITVGEDGKAIQPE